MRGMPDSVILGTIEHARRRAAKRRAAERRAGGKYADLSFSDYVGGTILLMVTLLAAIVFI